LVRVSRRAAYNHYASILAETRTSPGARRIVRWAITLPEGSYIPTAFIRRPQMMLACRRRVHRSKDRRNTADKSGCKRFPFNNFTCFLTLFPKCFSSFDHSTCALSVSGRYLALEEIYLPFRAAFPNNSTRRRSYVEGASRSHTGFSPSMTSCSKELRPAAAQKHPLQITTRACARFQI
jgi:hypothetical protein